MKLKFAKKLILENKNQLKWPHSHLGIVVSQESEALNEFGYSIPKLYMFTENQRILVIEWPKHKNFPGWEKAIESFQRFLYVYNARKSKIYGYMLAWSSKLEDKTCINIVYNFKESFTGAFFRRNYVYTFDKIGDIYIPNTLRRGGFGKNGTEEFYNLFEPLNKQKVILQ